MPTTTRRVGDGSNGTRRCWRILTVRFVRISTRLVLCAPGGNRALHDKLPYRLRESAPSPAFEAEKFAMMWRGLLRQPDRFATVDTGRLVDEAAPTTDEFKSRYAHLAPKPAGPLSGVSKTFGQGLLPVSALIVVEAVGNDLYSPEGARITTVLHQQWPGPVQVLEPWSGEFLDMEPEKMWHYLAMRYRDHGGGNGYTYEVSALEAASVENLRLWAEMTESSLADQAIAAQVAQAKAQEAADAFKATAEALADAPVQLDDLDNRALLDEDDDPADNEPAPYFETSRSVREVISWHVAAALIRRHPELLLVETHPGGGQYDCLSLHFRQDPHSGHHIDLNREGSAHIWSPSGTPDDGPDSWSKFWQDWLAAARPERVLEELEQRASLGAPNDAPATPPALCFEFIATVMKLTAFSTSEWRCVNGFLDSSGYGSSVREELFRVFPATAERRRVAMDGDLFDQTHYRFWFIMRDDEPVACLETEGTIWTLDGEEHDLVAESAAGATMHALIARWLEL